MRNDNIQFLPDGLPEDIEHKRKCVIILETEKIDGEYSPCIAVEGELGYYTTDWKWGISRKEADVMAEDYNRRLGIDTETTIDILLSSTKNL